MVLSLYDLTRLDYEMIIERSFEECDTFTMVTPFTPYGTLPWWRQPKDGSVCDDFVDLPPDSDNYGLSEEESDEILSVVYKRFANRAKMLWEEVPEKERKGVTSFEEFYEDLRKEREKIISASLTSDDVYVRYKAIRSGDPVSTALWSIYEDQSWCAAIVVYHGTLKKLTGKRDMLLELREAGNEPLLKSCIGSKLSHIWFGTFSGGIMVVHSFKCNNKTKQWFKNREDFYDFGPFQDPTFYKGKEVIFGVCTHEAMFLKIPNHW